MFNNNIKMNSSSSLPPSTGHISHLKEEENVIIRRPTNHNEISIMENVWNDIKYKVAMIKLQKHLDIPTIILGAIIPYTIELFTDYVNNRDLNFFPLLICIILYIIFKWLSKKIPILDSDNTEANSIHLNDLKRLIEQADYTEK